MLRLLLVLGVMAAANGQRLFWGDCPEVTLQQNFSIPEVRSFFFFFLMIKLMSTIIIISSSTSSRLLTLSPKKLLF